LGKISKINIKPNFIAIRRFLVFVFCLSEFKSVGWSQNYFSPQKPLKFHFHNDYLRKKPLEEALELGAASIEIDVYKYKNKLCVAHLPTGIRPSKTLDKIYIKPLLKLIKDSLLAQQYSANPLVLLIDCKSRVSQTLPLLQKYFLPLYPYLSFHTPNSTHKGLLQVVVCHASPSSVPDSTFWLIDKHDLLKKIPDNERWKYYMASYNWKKYFKWRGKDSIPAHERQLFSVLAENAHSQSLCIRFYNAPDFFEFWNWSANQSIDLIHTDRPRKYIKKLMKK
jgi:alkaline phosphatase